MSLANDGIGNRFENLVFFKERTEVIAPKSQLNTEMCIRDSRNGDWKLIYYYGTGKKELFNISDDIGEKNDLSTRHPEIVKRLSKELGDHLRKVDAQRPSFKATGKACPWPDEIN